MGNDISKSGRLGRSGRSSKNKGGDNSSSSRKSSRKSKNKGNDQPQAAAVSVTTNSDNKPHPPKVTMDSSAVTLGDAKINGRRDLHPNPVMITDNLSDVRIKYHINPKEIGHGHYGVVRKCMDRDTKVWYAIKSIRKSKVGKVDVLKREVALLKECDHPNIIQLVEVHEDQKYLHLITELCTGGELFDRIIEKTQSADGISDKAKDFICSLLKRDPSKRLTAREALNSPWITEYAGVKEPEKKEGRRRQRTSIALAPRSIAFMKYRDMQKLKKAALGWLAQNATNDDIEALKAVFKKIDVNNDGTITLQELDECLEDAHFLPNVTAELRSLREDLSVSGEDSLNWRDFIAVMMDKQLIMKEDNLRSVFEHFKKSDPHHIVVSDIVDAVGGSEAQAMEIMKMVDNNSDGRIDFSEFKKMMDHQD